MDKEKRPQCLECEEEADFIRHTQFAGSHPYCATHAKLEPDFNDSDSYKDWEDLNETNK